MKAIVEIPNGEPFSGVHILALETEPQIGHYVGDQNGRLYLIQKIVHLIDTNKKIKYPYLKLIVRKEA